MFVKEDAVSYSFHVRDRQKQTVVRTETESPCQTVRNEGGVVSWKVVRAHIHVKIQTSNAENIIVHTINLSGIQKNKTCQELLN
jgi:hypothetical protein